MCSLSLREEVGRASSRATLDGARTRLLIVTNRPLVRAGVAALLSTHEGRFEVIPADGDDPDVVLYDAETVVDELTLVQWITQSARFVVLGEAESPGAQRAKALGAVTQVTTCADARQLEEAVLLQRSRPVRKPDPWATSETRPRLTPREEQVLALIADGLSNKEIAAALYLSINSIKSYVRTCYRKIGAANRTQAVRWELSRRYGA